MPLDQNKKINKPVSWPEAHSPLQNAHTQSVTFTPSQTPTRGSVPAQLLTGHLHTAASPSKASWASGPAH